MSIRAEIMNSHIWRKFTVLPNMPFLYYDWLIFHMLRWLLLRRIISSWNRGACVTLLEMLHGVGTKSNIHRIDLEFCMSRLKWWFPLDNFAFISGKLYGLFFDHFKLWILLRFLLFRKIPVQIWHVVFLEFGINHKLDPLSLLCVREVNKI